MGIHALLTHGISRFPRECAHKCPYSQKLVEVHQRHMEMDCCCSLHHFSASVTYSAEKSMQILISPGFQQHRCSVAIRNVRCRDVFNRCDFPDTSYRSINNVQKSIKFLYFIHPERWTAEFNLAAGFEGDVHSFVADNLSVLL